MKDMSVSKALKWLFIAEILSLLSFIPLVGAILAIVAFVLNLLALYGASKLNEGYKNAFYLSIAGIVISVIALFASGVFGTIVGIVSTIVHLALLFFVVTTTCSLLDDRGESAVSAKGKNVWKLNLICTIVSVILSVLMLIPVLSVIAAVLTVVVAIVEIVAYIIYLVFLNKSYKALA